MGQALHSPSSPARRASRASRASRTLLAALASALALAAPAARGQQPASPDPALARQYFAEIKERCAADNGRLWGLKLGGPLLFVDRASGQMVANQPDPGHEFLKEVDGVFAGPLPETLQTANTAVDWAGARWSMVQWP